MYTFIHFIPQSSSTSSIHPFIHSSLVLRRGSRDPRQYNFIFYYISVPAAADGAAQVTPTWNQGGVRPAFWYPPEYVILYKRYISHLLYLCQILNLNFRFYVSLKVVRFQAVINITLVNTSKQHFPKPAN